MLNIKSSSAHRSVAICSFSIAFKLSVLVAADLLDSGVFTELSPFTEPEGVVVDVPVVVLSPPLTFAACFAAFSAMRFCFDAEGAIILIGFQSNCLYEGRGEKERKWTTKEWKGTARASDG